MQYIQSTEEYFILNKRESFTFRLLVALTIHGDKKCVQYFGPHGTQACTRLSLLSCCL